VNALLSHRDQPGGVIGGTTLPGAGRGRAGQAALQTLNEPLPSLRARRVNLFLVVAPARRLFQRTKNRRTDGDQPADRGKTPNQAGDDKAGSPRPARNWSCSPTSRGLRPFAGRAERLRGLKKVGLNSARACPRCRSLAA